MIFHCTPEDRDGQKWYKFARVVTLDEEQNEVETWYEIPSTRTHLIGVKDGQDVFAHNPDNADDAARLTACAEWEAPDQYTFHLKCPDCAAHCVSVAYGEPDQEGNLASMTLHDYDVAGLNRADIVKAILPGDYYAPE